MHRLTALLFASCSFAQTFDVAVIKPNNVGGGPYPQVLPGRLVLTYYSVRDLVALAYGLRVDQVVGDSFADHFDIEATTDAKTPGNIMEGPMLQTLLQERFQMKVLREIRQLPVFVLTVAKGGVKMPLTKPGGCTRFAPGVKPPYCDILLTGARGLARTMDGVGIGMDALVERLSRSELNRAVLNKTGLTGAYDITMRWAIDPSLPGLDDNLGGARGPDAVEGPSIFRAVEEQLGLKLDAARGPVEVIAMDRMEKPTPN